MLKGIQHSFGVGRPLESKERMHTRMHCITHDVIAHYHRNWSRTSSTHHGQVVNEARLDPDVVSQVVVAAQRDAVVSRVVQFG